MTQWSDPYAELASLFVTDPETRQQLESYVPLIQQGRGAEVLQTEP